MDKKTMGSFIAVLRKSQGMTQQELADRLNVSSKAVSRWERDESAPDISLIPAIAEVFDVTCDELLKGGRIVNTLQKERSAPKVDRQLTALLNRALANFKTMMWISLALSFVGLVSMLGISYGFYRPEIAFFVMMLFEIAAFVVAVIAVTRWKEMKTGNALLENADPASLETCKDTLGRCSYRAFFASVSIVFLSLPLLFSQEIAGASEISIYSVLNFEFYFLYFVLPIALLLWIAFYRLEKCCKARILGHSYIRKEHHCGTRFLNFNTLQLLFFSLSTVLFLFAPYAAEYESDAGVTVMMLVGFLIPIGSIIAAAVYILKRKRQTKEVPLTTIRNMLITVCSYFVMDAHTVSFYSESGIGTSNVVFKKYDSWNLEYVYYAVMAVLIIIVIFLWIERRMLRENTAQSSQNTDHFFDAT